jgi:hypothetical protein
MSLSVILTLLFVGLFLTHIVGPIAVYFICKFPVRQEFFPLTEEEIISCDLPHYQQRVDAVSAIGFEPVGRFQAVNSNQNIFTTVFYNFATRERAHVTYLRSIMSGSPKIASCMTEFMTEFANSIEVNTHNSRQLSVLDMSGFKITNVVPGLENPSLLYKVHQSITSARQDVIIELPPSERVAEELERDFDKTFRRQVETGYFFKHDATATYRPTAKGALTMSWKLLWPVGPVRKWQANQIGARLVQGVSNHP